MAVLAADLASPIYPGMVSGGGGGVCGGGGGGGGVMFGIVSSFLGGRVFKAVSSESRV